MSSRNLTLDREPTEILPDGFARDASISIRIQGKTTAVDATRSRYGSTLPMSMAQLAYQQLSKQYPQFTNYSPIQGEEVTTLRPGHQTTYVQTWQLGGGVTLPYYLWDNDFDLRSAPVTLDGMPDEYKQELQTQLTQIRRSRNLPAGAVVPAGGTPPPPAQ